MFIKLNKIKITAHQPGVLNRASAIPYLYHTLNVSDNLKLTNSKNRMDNLEIKRVTLKDIEQLQKIGRKTFTETF